MRPDRQRHTSAPPPPPPEGSFTGYAAGVLLDPAPQGRVGQHSGIGYELVLALDVPVLQLAEQRVDASSLAFLEEQEEKSLEVEYMELVRFGFSKSPASLERMKEVVRRRQVLRRKKKRRKKRTPRTSSSRSTPGRARRRHQQWHAPGWFSSVLAVFPSYVGRPKLSGFIVGLDLYCSLHRARHRQWQWHVQGWFSWLLFALCSFRSSTGPGSSAGMDPKDCFALFGISLFKARFTGDSAPRAVSFFLLLSVPDARHPGRHGPEGHLCCEVVAALVAEYGSGMFLLVLLVDAVRAVFASLSAGPPAGGQLRGVAGFAGDDTSRAVFLGCLRAQDARHFGRHGPEGQLRRRGQGLRSRSPWCGA